jgi:hypothetical protein
MIIRQVHMYNIIQTFAVKAKKKHCRQNNPHNEKAVKMRDMCYHQIL